MVERKTTDTKPSVYKKIVTKNNSSGELKYQYTIDVTEYDTSKMDGYVEGKPVYRGHTCKIATLKPDKAKARNRVDIDPLDEEMVEALQELVNVCKNLIKQKKG